MKKTLAMLSMLMLALAFTACGSSDEDTNNTQDITVADNTVEQDVTTDESNIEQDIGGGEVCTPACDGKQCGVDGCGGTCGTCDAGIPCVDGMCVCTPSCDAMECGSDGCGGSCGTCAEGATCLDGTCCTPDCTGKECGADGCGGVCGTCVEGTCTDMGICDVPQEMTCADIFDCLNTCPSGDQSCYQACITDAPTESQMEYSNIMDCLDTSGYFDCADTDEECMSTALDACETEYVQCFMVGDGTCRDLYSCLTTCETDEACSACYDDMGADGYMQWGTFIDCLDTNGYFLCGDDYDACVALCTEGDEACVTACDEAQGPCLEAAWGMCNEEITMCMTNGGTGTGVCKDLYLCLITCETDEACDACWDNVSVDAYNTWNTFIDCIDANGYFDCADGDTDCLNTAWTACDTEFTACANGDLSCVGILECLNACPETDELCTLECQVSGTIEAQAAFETIVDCILEACGEEATVECQNQVLGAGGVCESLYNDCMAN